MKITLTAINIILYTIWIALLGLLAVWLDLSAPTERSRSMGGGFAIFLLLTFWIPAYIGDWIHKKLYK